MTLKNKNNEINNIIKEENKTKTKNDILIKYLIKKDDEKINIFGANFVKNNKDKCKYIYENKEYELTKNLI